jgi:hypothetical protein
MKSTKNSNGGGGAAATGNNGGILGSGIFGMFGSIVNCDADSNSIYCNIVKMFNIMMIIGIVLTVIYLIYSYVISSKQTGGTYKRR